MCWIVNAMQRLASFPPFDRLLRLLRTYIRNVFIFSASNRIVWLTRHAQDKISALIWRNDERSFHIDRLRRARCNSSLGWRKQKLTLSLAQVGPPRCYLAPTTLHLRLFLFYVFPIRRALTVSHNDRSRTCPAASAPHTQMCANERRKKQKR